MQTVSILGSTGSIGVNTLNVIEEIRQLKASQGSEICLQFSIFALTANTHYEKLYVQCLKYQPKYAVIRDVRFERVLKEKISSAGLKTEILSGDQALIDVAEAPEVTTVMAAIVGIAGLPSAYAAAKAGKKVLLANKESLVSAGSIFMDAIERSGAQLLPVDSEHNAIFQCLSECQNRQYDAQRVDQLILTASGGPFRNKSLSDLSEITPQEAVQHPNWNMGAKISIDSSTMMNKALEMIEAYWLFDVPAGVLEVVLHPQSLVHSMVRFQDGSYIAQMGNSNMKTPIVYSLMYPERCALDLPRLDFSTLTLDFQKMDEDRFLPIKWVKSLLHSKNYSSMLAFNTVNEMMVEAFLLGAITYLDIYRGVEQALNEIVLPKMHTIEDVLAFDTEIRQTFRLMKIMKTK